MSEQESGQVSEEEKEAIKELIDSSNLSLIGDGTMIVKNTTIATTLNYIDKLQKELEEKTTILMAGADKVKQLEKENTELKEENEKINKVADKMYEYISYYGWEDFESNTGCNREEMVDYFYKE